MNYVSTVVGTLKIEDINLELQYMELISLGPADFKASPKLREAYRTKKIVDYDQAVHQKARRLKNYTSRNAPINKNNSQPPADYKLSESNVIKNSLEGITKKMDSLVGRINILITKTLESNQELNKNFTKFFEEGKEESFDVDKFNQFIDKTSKYHDKLDIYMSRKSEDDEKFDKLLDKLDNFVTKGMKINASNNGSSQYNGNGKGNSSYNDFEDIPTFIPKIEVSSVETSIKSKKVESEGTQDILKKLKDLKK